MCSMQCNVEFGYQLSICSRIEENHGLLPITGHTENTSSNTPYIFAWAYFGRRPETGLHVTVFYIFRYENEPLILLVILSSFSVISLATQASSYNLTSFWT
jgi:hypothetical protein